MGLPDDDNDRMEEVGAALFGFNWRPRLAAVLGISGSAVRQWRQRPPRKLDDHLLFAVEREIFVADHRNTVLQRLRNQLTARLKR